MDRARSRRVGRPGCISLPDSFNGALSTYEKLGFIRDHKIGKRWVVTKGVDATR